MFGFPAFGGTSRPRAVAGVAWGLALVATFAGCKSSAPDDV